MKQKSLLARRAVIWATLPFAAAAVLGACVPSRPSKEVASPTGLQVHLAEPSPGPGLTQASSTETTVYLQPDSLITSADTSLVRILPSPFGDYRIVVQLKEGVPDRLAPILRAHRGGTLAIIVDGRLVSTQPIDGSLGGRLTIANKFSKAKAEAIAKAI
ncbi:hypothetical protein KXR53_06660 [Inquilinus limosus]|uniref:hypothetical protein n=1 Tax=Inquilinus limosus TaxID=171674 RepID=UPI003F156505